MKNLLKGILLGVLLITVISAVTVYRIRDIQGDKAGDPTLKQELANRYTKPTADTTFVKVADGFQLGDSVWMKSDFPGIDSLKYDAVKKRFKYLSPDNYWRTIAIQDSSFLTNVTGLLTGMTSAWEFDEPSGTDATPAVGTLHGTAQGGVTVNQTGKIGKCWVLDNTNGYIEFADNALVDLTNNFTISIWFNAANYSTNRYIFTKGTGVYAARVNSAGPQFRVITTALTPTAANATTFAPVAAQWTHLVLTYSNGVGMKVYWNGVYKETLAMSGTLAEDNFSLKIGRYTGTEIFNGSIDQFIIWKSRILTDADVTTLYNSGNGLPTNQM